MTEPKFLLELLVRLFTDPPGFYRGGQHPDGGIGRQVRHIVFLPPLADEPHLLARHALYAIIEHSMFVAASDPNPAGGEAACQITFRAPAPGGLLPFFSGQHELRSDRKSVGDVVFSAVAGFRDGEGQSNIGRIDALAP